MKITIYQAKNPTFMVDKTKAIYDLAEYNKVYTFEQDVPEHTDKSALLEWVFERFNVAKPEDFQGHSFSVSDIVEFESDYCGRWTETYICDSLGWKKINWAKD